MNILIMGKDSYIGEHIKSHIEKSGHNVDIADAIGDEWRKTDFSMYDTVIHVAAIVHSNAKTALPELFEKVNTKLPVDVAETAKRSGVKQFVFISTMGVYGIEKKLHYKKGIITENTPLKPTSLYGKSKLDAEICLKKLADDNFRVAVVRPPNVYGHGCRGNYIHLFKKLSDLMIICPEAYTNIRQSMIYIDNLSELIRLIIEENGSGDFMPQDDYAPNATEIITKIRRLQGKKTIKSKFLGLFMRIFSFVPIVNKIYGGVSYTMSLSDCFQSRYKIVPFEEGMELTYQTTK